MHWEIYLSSADLEVDMEWERNLQGVEHWTNEC